LCCEINFPLKQPPDDVESTATGYEFISAKYKTQTTHIALKRSLYCDVQNPNKLAMDDRGPILVASQNLEGLLETTP